MTEDSPEPLEGSDPPAPPDSEGRTVFAPTPGARPTQDVQPAAPAPAAQSTAEPPSAPPSLQPMTSLVQASVQAPSGSGRIEVGALLNNIYRVTRLIGRGGMGEVWEGVNVASDERVAIKVMLPALAADANVQAMFRKEARILTRLQHPALVQYRVLAQEPTLGVLYIVTEFIDGPPLSERLGKTTPTPEQLRALTRRLAQGLGAAHELGAVHRDMSPDNVLLPEGRLDRAKVIDFGIAKDLDPTKQTIIGEGFAGKLGYVAPEQLGDFGREVGAWTDIYSLALVILSFALGRNVDMGATLVDAVDRRRAGPDLSAAPPELRPVLEAMLRPDPKQRLRSMEAVIAALDAPTAPTASAEARTVFKPAGSAGGEAEQAPAGRDATATTTEGAAEGAGGSGRSATRGKGPPLPLLIGGGVAVLLALGVGAFLLTRQPPPHNETTPTANTTASAPPFAGTADAGLPPSERARRAIEAAFPRIGCTWLDLTDIAAQGGAVSLKLAGVAGAPVAAQSAVTNAAAAAGARVADVNLEEVAPVDPPVCTALDAFRSIRADTSQAGRRLSTPQRTFVMVKQDNGKVAGRAVINMALRDPGLDFALFGLEPTGKIDAIIPSRAAFAALPKDGQAVADMGGDGYRLQIDTDHQGWSGLLLLTGRGPFDPALVAAPAATRGAGWPARFKAAAAAGGWKAEMVWYKTVEK